MTDRRLPTIEDDPAIMERMRRILDRFAEFAGDDMRPRPPKTKKPKPNAPPPRDRTTSIGPRTRMVLEFIDASLAAGRGFPSVWDITAHMRWPQDGAHRQAKDALKRLKGANLIRNTLKGPKRCNEQ